MTNGNESQESGDISRAEVTSQLGCEAGASQGQCRPGSWNVRVLAWNPKGQQACWGGTDGLQTGNQTLPNSLTEGP